MENMDATLSGSPMNTFVIRVWHERSAGGPQWRGRILHIQSGQSAAFVDLDGMLAFIHSFGVLVDDGPSAGDWELPYRATSVAAGEGDMAPAVEIAESPSRFEPNRGFRRFCLRSHPYDPQARLFRSSAKLPG